MEVSGQLRAPAALSPAKEPSIPIKDSVGHTAGLNASEKRKIALSCRKSNRDSPAIQSVA